MYKNEILIKLAKLEKRGGVGDRLSAGLAGAGVGVGLSGIGTLNRGNMHGETYGPDPFHGIDMDVDPDTAKMNAHFFNTGSGLLGAAAGDYVAKKLKLSTPWRVGTAVAGGVGNAALQAYLQDKAVTGDNGYGVLAPMAANAAVGAVAGQHLADLMAESDKMYREKLKREQQNV